MMRKFLLVVFLLLSLVCNIELIAAKDLDISKLQSQIASTIKKVSPAVVSITNRGSMYSGVIVSPEGHVLSAGHAVRPGVSYTIKLQDGRRLSAKGMGANTRLDCALLKINKPENLPYAEMGESAKLVTNQPCVSLSFPGGQGRSAPIVRFGHIKRKRSNSSMIQSTALMEPGDSGGPLFDLNGKVIGIHSRIGRQMDRNYDVPVDTFKKYWTQLNQQATFNNDEQAIPKIGIQVDDADENKGAIVYRVVANGEAKKVGLLKKDRIIEIQGRRVTSQRTLFGALKSAFADGAKEIKVVFFRDDEKQTVKIPFVLPKMVKPPYERFVSKSKVPPQPIAELANLPNHFAKLESRLDDNCVTITSDVGSTETTIVGTLIAQSRLIISKSSMVGKSPSVIIADQEIELEILARDSANDLVLIQSPLKNQTGVDLGSVGKADSRVGRFILSPDPKDGGLISVVSTAAFKSRKSQQPKRGYLGVRLESHENRGVVLNEVLPGAAKKAGLKKGDVITQMNDKKIRSHAEMIGFLSSVAPNDTVTASVERGDDKLTKKIILGSVQNRTNHAADMMKKSNRRDGFSRVLSHDADLKPEECGGPVYDLNGNFVGLNIARNSRVRSFAIPAKIIKSFVDSNKK